MIARLNLVLVVVLTACALALVTSQHRARKLYVELQSEEARARSLEVEWGQLQLEQSTWAMPGRIETLARQKLGMSLPQAERVRIVPLRGNVP